MTSLRFENLQEFPASVKASHQVFGTATFSPRYFQILFSFNLETSLFQFVFILRNRLKRSRKLHERVIQLFGTTNKYEGCWSGLAASCTLPPWNQKFRCKKSWVSLDTWFLSLFPIRMFNSDPLQCTTLAIRAAIFASRSLLTAFCASLTVWKAENVRNDETIN